MTRHQPPESKPTGQSPGSPPAEESPPGLDKGLTDPRAIHPGPEGEWPFPASTSGPDPSSDSERGAATKGPKEPAADASEEQGLVDPRSEGAGPDLLH